MSFNVKSNNSNFIMPQFIKEDSFPNCIKQENHINNIAQQKIAIDAEIKKWVGEVAYPAPYSMDSEIVQDLYTDLQNELNGFEPDLNVINSFAEESEKFKNRLSKQKEEVKQENTTSVVEEEKNRVLRSFVEDINKVKSDINFFVETKIKPDAKKIKELSDNLQKMNETILQKLNGSEEIKKKQSEIEELQEKLNYVYNAALIATKAERKAVVLSMNTMVGNDAQTKSKLKTLETLCNIANKFDIISNDTHGEINAAFELNTMKNQVFDGIGSFIMDPKKVVVDEIKSLTQ